MRTLSSPLASTFSLLAVLAVGCGGSDASAPAATENGAGGVSGSGGGTSSAGGASAGTGTSHGGQIGAVGGHSGGASGGGGATSAHGGSSGGSKGGNGGNEAAGAGGKGVGGMSGGTGGIAGAGGATTGCNVNADCQSTLPPTIPAACAHGVCNATSHVCSYAANDADGDGHPTAVCKAEDGTSIVVGDDCDDTDPNTNPAAWDGPKGDGHVDRCDGIDENCDGVPDDEKLMNGTSCTCAPMDVQQCSTDSSGKMITWPLGKPAGACKFGAQTCLATGTWGPCTGAVSPSQEVCDHLDNDCDGVTDNGPPPDDVPIDAIYFAYDGDDDDHAGLKLNGYVLTHACAFNPPTAPPAACTNLPLPCGQGTTVDTCCPPGMWKPAAGVPEDDCDDRNPTVSPTAAENCSTAYDDNCNGTINEGCACKPGSTTTCSETSSGAQITWPEGMPVGNCQYGSQVCNGSGQYGQCVGAVTPAPTDDCTKPADDSNCNGVPNDGCACIDAPTDPTYQTSCSALPDGTPIVWPGGTPKGTCAYGTKQCTTTGQYGTCENAVPPAAHDGCAVVGDDANCNGIPNEGCTCVQGQTTQCSALPNGAPITWAQPKNIPLGPCQYGVATCDGTGHYGTCVGAIAPASSDTCDPGNDANCDGTPNEGCKCENGATQACGSNVGVCKYGSETCANGQWTACAGGVTPQTETCNGQDDDCDGAVDDNIASNGSCTNGLGKCLSGGQSVCNSGTGGTFKCNAVPGAPDYLFTDVGYMNGLGQKTWDGDCSGTITVSHAGFSGATVYAGGGCGNTASYTYLCTINNSAANCAAATNEYLLVCTDIANKGTASECGVPLDQVVCAWNASAQTCSFSSLKGWSTQPYAACD